MKRIPLKMQLLAAEQELKDFSALFDLQHKRSVEANKMWQKDTGEQCNPDLGELLRYFMAQRDLLDEFYWLLREGKYASDEYVDAMERYERKDFCRSNADLPLSTSDLFCKSFSIRRDVLDLTMAQWKIAESLDLSSITPRDWIRAIGGGRDGSPMWVRICSTGTASVMKAMMCMSAPQLGQTSGLCGLVGLPNCVSKVFKLGLRYEQYAFD